MTALTLLFISCTVQGIGVVLTWVSFALHFSTARLYLCCLITLMEVRRLSTALNLISDHQRAALAATGPEWSALAISCFVCAMGVSLIRQK